ncbi:hypothetical protein AB0M94_39545 [Streptomyces xanthochromogenes]|uniref:hypothetical protein n=1 Tax=Streptomyces xanthochromogenes TaxID=67384 RepID=UPI003428A7F6
MSERESIDGDSGLVGAKAPVSGVSVPRHLGVGSDLVHSLDYVVMLQVMFNIASQVKCTPMDVWHQLQARGIRSAKNADELVGKNAVYESFARLLEAGYLRRTRLPHPTKQGRLGPMSYEVFDNPAWNPDHFPAPALEGHGEVKPQVGTRPGTPDVESREKDKTAGGNTSRNAGRGNSSSGVPGRGKRHVSAGGNTSPVPGRGMAPPPHPPGEVTTSPPSSPTDLSGALPSQRGEEEAEFSPKDVHAAESFLQKLRPPHHMGAVSARKYAPMLLRSMAGQGWPSVHDVDQELLTRELTRDPDGFKRPSSLVPTRIRDLARYDVVTGAGTTHGGSSSGPERCPEHPFRYRSGCAECALAVPD